MLLLYVGGVSGLGVWASFTEAVILRGTSKMTALVNVFCEAVFHNRGRFFNVLAS